MTKYSKYITKTKPRKVINPIWRGVGCLLMVTIPTISYFLAYIFLQEAKARELVPPGLLGYIQFPDWVWKVPFLSSLLAFIAQLKDVWAMLVFFLAILLLITGLVTLVYTAVYQLLGPPRYSELDAPPEKRKVREYKR